MGIYVGLLVLALIGIGAVVWVLIQDKKNQDLPVKEIQPHELTALESADLKSIDLKNDLPGAEVKKPLFRFLKKRDELSIPEPTPLPNLKEHIDLEEKLHHKNSLAAHDQSTGTASMKTTKTSQRGALSAEDEKKIESDIHLSLELAEFKTKHEQMEKLLKEKSDELERSKKSLENESKNNKEFNKIKDILEKELKESKDKARTVKAELTSSQMEGESYKKRILQLEEKVTKLGKDILAKEKEIENLNKEPQPATAPATVVATPAPIPSVEATASSELSIAPLEKPAEVKQETPEAPKETPVATTPQTPLEEAKEEPKETPFLKLPPDPLSKIVLETPRLESPDLTPKPPIL